MVIDILMLYFFSKNNIRYYRILKKQITEITWELRMRRSIISISTEKNSIVLQYLLLFKVGYVYWTQNGKILSR